jgi:hypothetical protein
VIIDYRVLAYRPQAVIGCAKRGFSETEKRSILGLGCKGVGRSGPGIGRKEICHMAIESHLAELEKRHQALEQEISEALTHPSSDDLQIAELKRKKLHVKDEITRLRHEVFVH